MSTNIDQTTMMPNQTTMTPNQTTTMTPNQTTMIPNQTTMIPNQTTMIPNQTTMIPNQTTTMTPTQATTLLKSVPTLPPTTELDKVESDSPSIFIGFFIYTILLGVFIYFLFPNKEYPDFLIYLSLSIPLAVGILLLVKVKLFLKKENTKLIKGWGYCFLAYGLTSLIIIILYIIKTWLLSIKFKNQELQKATQLNL
jgi:hypothetical protein